MWALKQKQPTNREEIVIMKNYTQISENKERIGNTTFIIRSHFNTTAKESAEQLILKLMESKIKNESEEKVA